MRAVGLLTEHDYRLGVKVRLRALIDALNISQVEAAKDMGISKNRLGNWLRLTNIQYPDPYCLYKFCRLRSVTADWIYLDDPARLPDLVRRALLEAEPISMDHAAPAPKAIEKSSRRRHQPAK